jgi:AraC-like DNA-binding protein
MRRQVLLPEPQYREMAPPAALAPWVECFWTLDSAAPIPGYAVPPDGCLDIVFSEDEGLRAIGAMTVEHRYDLRSARTCGVRFRPGMAGPFLKAPAAELTDRELALEDLWGGPARALREQLANAPFAVETLCAALPRPAAPTDAVLRAIAGMTAVHGAADVDAIARAANLSPRQFQRRCLEATGLSPKHLCRILRFRRASELAARTPGLKWSLIAIDAGYFDQAHLIRDFREFTGRSPMSVFSNTGAGGRR